MAATGFANVVLAVEDMPLPIVKRCAGAFCLCCALESGNGVGAALGIRSGLGFTAGVGTLIPLGSPLDRLFTVWVGATE